MSQILIHAAGMLLGALIIALLGLNRRHVVISQARPVSWIWKALKLIGKFLFWYGLLVFFANLTMGGGIEAYNTRLGISLLTFGLIFWGLSSLFIYFKRG